MKLSLNWIKDYIDIPADLELSKIAYDLTMSTVEVEGITELGKKFDMIAVGIVKEISPHPNADKLRICKTDIGNEEIRDIVCGGINLKEGMKVALALPGAKVRWHGTGDPVEIKIAKLRGVESYGMICASSEIGLFDLFPYTEDGTIIDLSEFETKAGTSLADVLGLNDAILEIDNKSLTNRPDLWGHYGIAREISALYDLPLKEFLPFTAPAVAGFEVAIDDTSRCARYIGVKMEGLSVKESPFAVKSRLWSVGLRPINAIVDITNYVMLSTGQPTHAFDADHIKGHIRVRCAQDGEKLILLNKKELLLSTEDLVIADNESPVALAGVMGGEKDSVLPETKNVILEIANFEAVGVRRTATRYENRTESAVRYEKGIDPQRCDLALSLSMQLFKEIFPNFALSGFCDNYPVCLKEKEIDVSLNWLEKRLGKKIPDKTIASKLESLGFKVKFDGDIMHITAPSWRSTGDISIPDDIMEETARMYGFENFEPAPITTAFEAAINQPEIDIDRKIREFLAFRCGMQEIFTYPWVEDEFIKAVLHNSEGMLSLSSPPSSNESFIRSSLLPNLCKAAAGNLRFFKEFAIFESAQVFFDRNFEAVYDSRELLPLKRRNAAGAFVGDAENASLLFRKAKGVIEALPRYIHAEKITFNKTKKPVWADDDVWFNIFHCDTPIGNLALLSKKASLDCGIKNSAVMLFEIEIDCLKPYPSRTNKFKALPEYPVTEYDLSLLLDLQVNWSDIIEIIDKQEDSVELLQDVFFVDEYKGKQIPEGKKSVTCRLIIRSLKKTLTSQEIESYAGSVIEGLKKNLRAELRK